MRNRGPKWVTCKAYKALNLAKYKKLANVSLWVFEFRFEFGFVNETFFY